jgi:hypothetical protein
MHDLDAQKAAIQRLADSGQISQIEAQGKILNLEGDRLAKLREIGAQMTKNAEQSKDPAAIQAAQDFNAKLDDMDAKLSHTTNAWGELVDQISTTGRDAMTSAFTDIITQTKGFGQAWADLGKAFEGIVAKMIAQLISFYLMVMLLRAINPEAADALEAQGPFGGKGFAGGGYTGRIGRNRVAGVVHGEEFVVRAGPADQYRPLLEAMNEGTMPSLVRTGGYYGGGYVDSMEGGSPVSVLVQNHTGQPAQTEEKTGIDGQKIIEVIIGEVAGNIRKGGTVAQALSQTFGVNRQGVKRG